jgi:hypothetical protein
MDKNRQRLTQGPVRPVKGSKEIERKKDIGLDKMALEAFGT